MQPILNKLCFCPQQSKVGEGVAVPTMIDSCKRRAVGSHTHSRAAQASLPPFQMDRRGNRQISLSAVVD